jgi:hypothetical protein
MKALEQAMPESPSSPLPEAPKPFAPHWRYHEKLAPEGKLVDSVEKQAALLGEGWVDTPAKFAGSARA